VPPEKPSLASETARERISVRLRGLCEGPPTGVCVCDRLYAFGFEATGVCVGVWLKGTYRCWASFMPAGLLREWLWPMVFDREGGWLCVYWGCCACKVGTAIGAVNAEEGPGLELPPGCNAPGIPPALEGTTLPCGVA